MDTKFYADTFHTCALGNMKATRRREGGTALLFVFDRTRITKTGPKMGNAVHRPTYSAQNKLSDLVIRRLVTNFRLHEDTSTGVCVDPHRLGQMMDGASFFLLSLLKSEVF